MTSFSQFLQPPKHQAAKKSNFYLSIRSGFALPPKEILSVSRELWEGVKVTARFAHEAPFGEDKVILK